MHTDTQYPDPDLIKGHITRKGVKTFHTEALLAESEPDLTHTGGGWFELADGTKVQGKAEAHRAAVLSSIAGTGRSWCDLELTELTEAGWARGLRRQGLTEHAECAKAREAFLESLEEAAHAGEEADEGPSEAESQ